MLQSQLPQLIGPTLVAQLAYQRPILPTTSPSPLQPTVASTAELADSVAVWLRGPLPASQLHQVPMLVCLRAAHRSGNPANGRARHLVLSLEPLRRSFFQPCPKRPGGRRRSLLGGLSCKIEGLDVQLLESGGVIKWEGVEPAPPSPKNKNGFLQVVVRILKFHV